jgi:hypothetical protein
MNAAGTSTKLQVCCFCLLRLSSLFSLRVRSLSVVVVVAFLSLSQHDKSGEQVCAGALRSHARDALQSVRRFACARLLSLTVLVYSSSPCANKQTNKQLNAIACAFN